MNDSGQAKRVRIYFHENDRIEHRPAGYALLDFFRREQAGGATLFKGLAGLGSSGRLNVDLAVDSEPQTPMLLEWIDAPERVERLLPKVKELLGRGLITIDDVEIALHAPHGVRDLSPRLTVGEVMSREVAFVAKATPIHEVVERMLGKIWRAIPVIDAGKPIGIVSNSDLVLRGGMQARLELLAVLPAAERDAELARLRASARTAGEIMTPNPVTVLASAHLPDAAAVMARHRLKRLPVVDESGVLVGVLSRLDLLRTAAGPVTAGEQNGHPVGLRGDLPVSKVMRRDAPTVHPETSLAEVMQAVISTRLNRALVVDAERRVVGVITDEELLDRVTPALRPNALRSLMHRLPFAHPPSEQLATEQHARAHRAADLMVREVPTVAETALLREAIAVMLRAKHKLVAAVDADGRLTGVLDRADVLRGLAELNV